MKIRALTKHAGVSFDGGPELIHLRLANADSRLLRATWDRLVVESGIGDALRVREVGKGELEASARAYPFVPLATLARALRAGYAGKSPSPATADELSIAGADARMYAASYGLHVRAAARRGWIAQPMRIGFMPAVLLGAGRHARFLVMNLPMQVSSTLTLAGISKANARDLLAAHGLPVAPGGLAGSPQAALRIARELGGPVVIKRLVGGNSDGVIVGVQEPRDITSAARMLLAGNYAVLVESLVAGTELRLHFLNGKLHRAYRAEPFTITGDGRRSLAALMAAAYPRYLQVMTGSSAHRRRLVMCLWSLGVRKVADLDTTIPSSGRVVRISAATGAGMDRVDVREFLRTQDIAKLERFLAHHGSPSGGMDVVVRAPGAPLDDGAAILEMNIPCGFAYLDDPARAVSADLDAAIAGDATFRREKGRVPVWLVAEPAPARLLRDAERALAARHGRVVAGSLTEASSNWISLLNQPDADALLIRVTEAAVIAHGMPANLAPILIEHGDGFAERYPATCATVRHAKGKRMTLPPTSARASSPRAR